MKIFISGASGLVGGNCLDHLTAEGHECVGTYFSFPTQNTVYYDTLHPENPENFDVHTFQPEVIIHCGALTHVDYCEDHVEESYQKTVQSTLNLLRLAESLNARLVYLSTDYVFDGTKGPYREEDTVNPLGVYAEHKLEAEQAVVHANPKHLVIRITNVYGKEIRNKNFIARIIEQCHKGEALTLNLPYDQYATPVNAYDVARAIGILLRDHHQGIFHIASTDFMNRVELALNVLKHFPTAKYTLHSLSTDELKQPARRPLMSGLIKEKFSKLYPEFRFTTVDEWVSNNK